MRGLCLLLTANCLLLTTAVAEERPSLFRGVVVAEAPVGVRVVSIEEASQASLADLRPDDVIVRIKYPAHGRGILLEMLHSNLSMETEEVHSLQQFAEISRRLKGRATTTQIVVFRQGVPRELSLHLYSYPIVREWGLEFLPDHDLRFAQPSLARAYWARLSRGFAEAGKPDEALNASLNALHADAGDVGTALTATVLSFRIAQEALRAPASPAGRRELPRAIVALQRALTLMERLVERSLTEGQYQGLRDQLAETLRAFQEARRQSARQP